MSLTTYPRLTEAKSDSEFVWLWISQKSKTTRQTYVMVARQFLDFSAKTLRQVMLEDILLWLESYQLRESSQNTINNKLAVIKSLFSFGVTTGYLQTNPAALIKTSKAKDALNERILEFADIQRLIKAATPGRNLILLKLVYILGLRVSELVNLNWSDFQLTDTGVVVTIFGKGSKTRTLLIGRQLWLEINSLPKSELTNAVFLSRFGNRMDRHAIHRMVKATAQAAGINPHTSIHWLRHAHACHSLKNGAGVELLMKSLGHSSLAVTSRYLHVRPDESSSQFIKLE